MKPIYIPSYAAASPADLASVPWGTFTDARQECFMSLTTDTYTYGSGRGVRTYTPIPFLPWVESIRQFLNDGALNGRAGHKYNVCFLNRYADASQHLGWHADDSPGMDHEHPIAVISFGQAREIWWRRKDQKGVIPADQRQLLEHGSLFVMPAGMQRDHEHRIPKGDKKMEPRVSLTFRHYIPDLSIDEYEKKSAIAEGLYVPDGWL